MVNGINTSQTVLMSDEERRERNIKYAKAEAERYNSLKGDLTGYDCPKCKNKGWIGIATGENWAMAPCECMKIRNSMSRLERSGLANAVREYTFKNYRADEPWQKNILTKAVEFAKAPEGWFYIGGQVGSGKTHICTAITAHLLKKGKEAVYMRWIDDTVKLKALKNYDEDYSRMIDKFKGAEVLYIDDFFKTEKGQRPTAADVNIAFELLNHRYNNRQLITIISSEKTLNELLDVDEAVGSRIKHRCGGNYIQVERGADRNYRLRGNR